MEPTYDGLIEKAIELGASEAKIMDTDKIVFDPRSFFKCRFGCNRWGKFWTCPPNMHMSYEMFMDGFKKYRKAMVLKSVDPQKGQEAAVGIEKEAMMNHGALYAFALALCVQCEECAYPDPCRFPHLARPSMDAYGMDIEKTIEPLHFKVEFDKEGKLLPAWYSMVLLD